MTPERLAEIRALCQREYGVSPSIACEMLGELDRLRATVEAARALTDIWLSQVSEPEAVDALTGDDEMKVAAAFTFIHTVKACRTELREALKVTDAD